MKPNIIKIGIYMILLITTSQTLMGNETLSTIQTDTTNTSPFEETSDSIYITNIEHTITNNSDFYKSSFSVDLDGFDNEPIKTQCCNIFSKEYAWVILEIGFLIIVYGYGGGYMR